MGPVHWMHDCLYHYLNTLSSRVPQTTLLSFRIMCPTPGSFDNTFMIAMPRGPRIVVSEIPRHISSTDVIVCFARVLKSPLRRMSNASKAVESSAERSGVESKLLVLIRFILCLPLLTAVCAEAFGQPLHGRGPQEVATDGVPKVLERSACVHSQQCPRTLECLACLHCE